MTLDYKRLRISEFIYAVFFLFSTQVQWGRRRTKGMQYIFNFFFLADQDGAEPCGNSVSVHNLLRLAAYLDRQDLRAKAGKTLTCFSEKLSTIPVALPEMMSALMFYHEAPTQVSVLIYLQSFVNLAGLCGQVFIAGEPEDNNTQALLDVVRNTLIPGRILAVADGPGGRAGLLYRRHETLARLHPIHGKSAAYVCRNFTCSLPVTDPIELANSLDQEVKFRNRASENSV